jgi:hypothetical protein
MVVDDSEERSGGVRHKRYFLLDDLSWRVEKLRLEERNKERFLKAETSALPYICGVSAMGPKRGGVDGKAKEWNGGLPWEKNKKHLYS